MIITCRGLKLVQGGTCQHFFLRTSCLKALLLTFAMHENKLVGGDITTACMGFDVFNNSRLHETST